jgi:hypothetical protein
MLKLRSIFLLSNIDYYWNNYHTREVVIPSRIPMLLSRSDSSNELFWYLDDLILDFNNDLNALPTPLHTQEAKDALSDYLKVFSFVPPSLTLRSFSSMRSRDVLFSFRTLFRDLGSLPGLIIRHYLERV